jgi:hypothetical protein
MAGPAPTNLFGMGKTTPWSCSRENPPSEQFSGGPADAYAALLLAVIFHQARSYRRLYAAAMGDAKPTGEAEDKAAPP